MSRSGINNILKVFNQATELEIEAGKLWYGLAHQQADDLHIGPEVGAGVVAALSPGLRWENNIEAARRVIGRESLDGLGVRYRANVAKAERICMGESPDKVLGGNKVRAFYRCILDPSNKDAVCVDGHAFGIWSYKRVPLDKVPNLARRNLYHRIAGDYFAVAGKLGMIPNQVQAITWVAWRRLHGVENGGNGHTK